MPTTDSHGYVAPVGTDPFAPSADMQAMRPPLHPRTIIPVANATAQTALYNAHAPTPSKPLFVYRTDLDLLQYTTGGNVWKRLDAQTSSVMFTRLSNTANITAQTTVTGLTLVTADSSANPASLVTVNAATESGIAAGGMFTIQKAGRWRLAGRVVFPNTTATTAQVAVLMRNGSNLTYSYHVSNGQPSTIPTEVPSVRLNVGDKIQLQAASPSSSLPALGDPTAYLTYLGFTYLGESV